MAEAVTLYINRVQYKLLPGELPSDFTLNDFIRDKALLKGTKVMCREGGCGVCTISVDRGDGSGTLPVNSCLMPIYTCHGWNVTTIEGLGDAKKGYNKIQQTLADYYGSQCGYCSPGMVMTMYGSAQQSPEDFQNHLEESFDGNICRCTGYRPIMDAMQKCAPTDIEDLTRCYNCPRAVSCPPHSGPSNFKSTEDTTWFYPSSIEELRSLVSEHADVKYYVVAGHTGVGVYKKDGPFSVYFDTNNIPELKQSTQTSDEVYTVGAGVSLTQLMANFKKLSASNSSYTYLEEIARYLEHVANLQVRNVGTWAGNLMIKYKHNDFASDVFTMLECVGAKLNVYDCKNQKALVLAVADLLTHDMTGSIIESMSVPAMDGWALQTYKVMPRYRNAHSLLSLALFVKLDGEMTVTVKPSLTYAGVSTKFVHAFDVEEFLTGKALTNNACIQGCMDLFGKVEFDDKPILPSVTYRKSLMKSLFYKAVLSMGKSMCKPELVSGGELLVRPALSSGKQDYPTDPSLYPMTEPLPKLDARKQTAGEAQFIGDIPAMIGQLYAVFVKTTIGSGYVDSIDMSGALVMPGVVRVLTYKDIPGRNQVDTNEPLLCEDEVMYYGQPIAIVIAESEREAMAARELVEVQYKEVKTPITTIEQAIIAKSFFPKPPKAGWDAVHGDAAGALKSSDVTMSGMIEIGEQYPMYTETQVCVVDPQEGYYLVLAATQVMGQTQASVARLLGITSNEVEVKVRRVGGGFGGKQSRSMYVSGAAALSSYHTQRPVKMCLRLEDNMEIIGRRQPFRVEYQVGVNKDLKIQAISGNVYENCGFQINDSAASVSLRWMDNAYYIPNWNVTIVQCKTNEPNHAYVRAPGIISVMHFIERIVDDLAAKLKVSPEVLKLANLYQEGQMTPYGDLLSPCYVEDMWNQVKSAADYDNRVSDIQTFNSSNVWRKKAICMTPLKYGMAFFLGSTFLVHVSINYYDGTVTVIHAGVELGQGINTKAIQVAAATLGIGVDKIKVQPSSTSININPSETGGSVTSDMNCLAVKNACDTLVQRMAPYKTPGLQWIDVVKKCQAAEIDLHSKFFMTDKLMASDLPGFWDYNIFGAACTEVELDVLTGSFIIQRMDVLYDCGSSYSPEIDIGQIEGAIVMGLGLLFHEEIKYDRTTGQMLTDNTWNYHVPMNRDIPVDLRVNLLRDKPNKYYKFGSKIVGEPPLLLAESAVTALRKCIIELRTQQGNPDFFSGDSPLTTEKVFLACALDSSKFLFEGRRELELQSEAHQLGCVIE